MSQVKLLPDLARPRAKVRVLVGDGLYVPLPRARADAPCVRKDDDDEYEEGEEPGPPSDSEPLTSKKKAKKKMKTKATFYAINPDDDDLPDDAVGRELAAIRREMNTPTDRGGRSARGVTTSAAVERGMMGLNPKERAQFLAIHGQKEAAQRQAAQPVFLGKSVTDRASECMGMGTSRQEMAEQAMFGMSAQERAQFASIHRRISSR